MIATLTRCFWRNPAVTANHLKYRPRAALIQLSTAVRQAYHIAPHRAISHSTGRPVYKSLNVSEMIRSAMSQPTGRPVYEPLNVSEKIQGESGREYSIEKIMQEKKYRFGRVYLATYVL
jgi:hypothetical protein